MWEEYREGIGEQDTLGLSQFCELYAAWRKSLDLVMRQTHVPGERAFMDFAGDTVTVHAAGGPFEARLFVAVMGMSNFTFAHAFADEKRASWLTGHSLAFEYFGGVPELVVLDNPKQLVHKPNRYEPDLNPEYVELARHYGTAILPARVARPRDKAKVEAGVLLAERWILASLRKRHFHSLVELNEAISKLLEKPNSKPFKKMDGSRASVFASHEAAVLRPHPIRSSVEVRYGKILFQTRAPPTLTAPAKRDCAACHATIDEGPGAQGHTGKRPVERGLVHNENPCPSYQSTLTCVCDLLRNRK